MGSEGVIESEEFCDVETTIFVAVGKNVKEGKSLIYWALQNFKGKKICLLHIHQPAQLLTLMDLKLSGSKLKQQATRAFRDLERQKMGKILDQYSLILTEAGVRMGKVWIEMDNVEKAIVQTIKRYGIRWLVMGAAAEKQYSKLMLGPKSNKAIFVCEQAPIYCHIWFACKGCLVYTRPASTPSHVGSTMALPPPVSAREKELAQYHEMDADKDVSAIQCLNDPTISTENVPDAINTTPLVMHDMIMDNSPLPSAEKIEDHVFRTSSIIVLEEQYQGQSPLELHDKVEHAMLDAEKSKQKTFEKSVRRRKPKEDLKDVLEKVEASESLYMQEASQRKELEEMLEKQKEEIETMTNQQHRFMEELQVVHDEMPALENQITKSHNMEKELEDKIIQAVRLLITFKESRDKVQEENDRARREVNRLRAFVHQDTMRFRDPQFLTSSFLEILEATQTFHASMKIGDGRYGSVFKGLIHHVAVAIKMLPSLGYQGDSVFEYEAEVLSRMRHPNLITLIGICPESRSLIYEYLENGSLEDRIACEGKTPPLSWQTRIRIAIEICCALIFLHSNNPHIVHGNLKPSNVLLDSNHVCKPSDLGIHRLVLCQDSTSITSLYNNLDPEVSAYTDPDIFETGELTPYSDVYSFGVVLLRILTGRPASTVIKDMKCAIQRENLSTVLDSSAGNWPLDQAKQLAGLALQCCEKNPVNRPDLATDVWAVIEPMRDLCSALDVEHESHSRVPSYFVCPIFQEVMKDPQIAADGYTYEADAIRGWLDKGHKTSPMTNLKLEHCDLLPNYALYYAIQEWQQRS